MTQVSFFELFFVGLASPLFGRISNARWDWFFPLVLKYFFDFLESQISLLVFVGASFVFKLKLPGAGNICNNWFEFHAQKCRQIFIMNGHSYQWQVDTYHAHQRNQEWRHYIASSDFESGRPTTKSLVDLDDNRPSESGQWASLIWNWEEGKKTQRTPAWKFMMEQRKQESQLFDDNESEKNEGHSSSVQIGLFIFCGPLPAILLEWSFIRDHWIASPNWSFIV